MKRLFTHAAWQKMDDVERILMSVMLALLAIYPVLLAPKLWGTLLSLGPPNLVGLREMLLIALYQTYETPDAIMEALAAMTLGAMMLAQLLQALLRAAIRGRLRAGKDGTNLSRKETPLAWTAWLMLALPSIAYGTIFMVPDIAKPWELDNAAVTNGALVFTIVVTILAMFMSAAVAAATVRGFSPDGPIKTFTCLKAPWAMLCILTSGFEVNVIAITVSMVILDVLLAPLDDAPAPAASSESPALTKA